MQQYPKLSLELLLLMALGTCVLLAGCADARPTFIAASATPPPPTAIAVTSTPTTSLARSTGPMTEGRSNPTLSPGGSVSAAPATKAPTATLALPPTDTARPTQTSTLTATPIPTSTPSRDPTPTFTATATPSPRPKSELEEAQQHQLNGDYGRAIGIYLALLSETPASEQARQAHYHLAESYLLNRDYGHAAATWKDYLTRYPDDTRLLQATLMLARAYAAIGDCSQAIPHYQSYVAGDAVLADMVSGWLGDCLIAEGDIEGAIQAYQGGLPATDDRAFQFDLREKIAAGYMALGEYDAAVAEYDAMLPLARFDYQRANVEYQAGQALAEAEQMEAALTRYRRAVDNYPRADSAYLSLIELVDAGIAVDDFQRGMVDYWAGENHPEAYIAAIRAFDRYLATDPSQKGDEALYYQAKAHRSAEQAGAALESLQRLITGYPESSWQVSARMEKAATQAWLGRSNQAVQTYRDLAAQFSAHELAPQALWQAAKLREKEGAYVEAAVLYEELQAGFPTYQDAAEALWRAGLAYYRADDRDKAVADWQLLTETYPGSSYRAKSLYWLGKLGVAPLAEGESSYWEQLVAAMPDNYYALRVNQIRTGEALTSTRFVTGPLEPYSWNEDEAQEDVLAWLRDWTQVPDNTSLQVIPVSLAASRNLERGAELLAIGLRKEAVDAFDQVRGSAWDEPLSLAQLAFFLHERGFYGLAARSALRLAALWPNGSIYTAPPDLQRLAYPLAYVDLLSTEAQVRDLDPLLLASLIRQESLFEPTATSYAGARGLGQVMPATGKGIARSLDIEGFEVEDLYRPSISAQFGAYYLAVQMKQFDDQYLIALAAYNGGPGNTRRWVEAGGDDLDFFVEIIVYDQSRVYVQKVYQGYIIYERLYRPSEDAEQ